MSKEPRPNWLASAAAVAGVLGVAVLLQVAFAQLGLSLDEGTLDQVLRVLFLLVCLVASTYLIALLVLLGFGWMDEAGAGLYAVAATVALLAAIVAAALARRSTVNR